MFFRKTDKQLNPDIFPPFFKFEKLNLSFILVQGPNITFHLIPKEMML